MIYLIAVDLGDTDPSDVLDLAIEMSGDENACVTEAGPEHASLVGDR